MGSLSSSCSQEQGERQGIKSMQVYSSKHMECIRWLTLFIEFSFSDQKRKLFKLKNLGSLRELVRVVLHIPSLKEEEEGPQEVRAGLVKPKVRPSLLEFLLSRPLAFWTIDAVQHVWGEISNRLVTGDLERSPPHLFLYLALSKRKTKVETRDSAGLEHRWV